jgi:hypothetical protein
MNSEGTVHASDGTMFSRKWGPSNFFERWWVRSRLFDVLYSLMLVSGVVVMVVVAVDVLVAHHAHKVWIPQSTLDSWSFAPIGLSWILMIATFATAYPGIAATYKKSAFAPPLTRKSWWILGCTAAVAGLICAFALDAGRDGDKGDLRVLPGPIYQVSTLWLKDGNWVTISHTSYVHFQLAFIRGTAMTVTFGFFAACSALLFLLVKRDVRATTAQ